MSSNSASAGDRTSSSIARTCESDSRLHPCFLCIRQGPTRFRWLDYEAFYMPKYANSRTRLAVAFFFCVHGIQFLGIRPWGNCRTSERFFFLFLSSEESYGFSLICLLTVLFTRVFQGHHLCCCVKHETGDKAVKGVINHFLHAILWGLFHIYLYFYNSQPLLQHVLYRFAYELQHRVTFFLISYLCLLKSICIMRFHVFIKKKWGKYLNCEKYFKILTSN